MTNTRQAIEKAVRIAERHLTRFADVYPDDVTTDGAYKLRQAQYGEPEGGNTEWTTGFLPGMLWVLGEATGNEALLDGAHHHVANFTDRIDRQVHVNHHDLGFLYTPSCLPAVRLRGDEQARSTLVKAADTLMVRVLDNVGIIQAWGDLSDPANQGRTIIDSLLNVPLLYWATENTGDPKYREAAIRHTEALAKHIVRDDNTTHHTFHWDPETGEPLYGTTAQGYSDDSTWARGQAWGIYGFALGHRHTGNTEFLELAERLADRFLSLLPEDKVAYWDMVFTDGDDEERDSSAAAIAVCGLLELADATGKEEHRTAALEILDSLINNYATDGEGPEDCLILHGVYHKKGNSGVDEGNLWGDYFYAEALLRVAQPDWVPYWHPSK